MLINTAIEVLSVWIMTGLANLLNYVLSDFVIYLPLIQNLLGIVSLILAITYTLYKFRREKKKDKQ